jgi:ATPase subunit of ABC transporter with duplicated ATPase domains
MVKAMRQVLFEAPGDRVIKSFSGGQQARLLLAAAIIQEPSILLLDEPTNNLDSSGLFHLQSMIQTTEQTCVVISHDEDFLNAFTDQVRETDRQTDRPTEKVCTQVLGRFLQIFF